ncbi:MAG: glycosyltransferase family 4 protein [Shewanella sp.]
MKILTVVCNLNKGGTQRAAQFFAQAFLDLGYESRLVAVKAGGIRETFLADAKLNYWIGLENDVIKSIKEWSPDLIHLHSHGLSIEDILILKSCVRSDVKFVETNVFSNPSEWIHMLDYSFQLSNWCDYLYRYKRQYVVSDRHEQSIVIPNPVRIESFNRTSSDRVSKFRDVYHIGNSPLIGRVGQSLPSKWSTYIIDVFSDVKEKINNAKLLIVNPPEVILSQAMKSKYKNDIIIIDEVKNDLELSTIYSAIDVFLLISEQGESFGYVSAEALLCETPVVTLNTPWADNSQCEIIGPGGISVNDKRLIAASVIKLINDDALRFELGKKGREHIIDSYCSIKLARKVIDTIKNGGAESDYNRLFSSVDARMKQCDGNIGHLTRFVYRHLALRIFSRYTTGYESWMKIFSLIKKKFLH